MPSLRNWLRRGIRRSQRRADAGAGSQWLSGLFHEPRSDGFHLLRPRELAYRLYLPAGTTATDRLPLLIMLHGCSQSATEFAEGTRMNPHADVRRCAVLYPEQSRRANAHRCWNWYEPQSLAGEGEAALIVHTILDVMASHPIDPTRVYVAGLSAGGAMVAVLCSTHGNLFAAGAIHSGVMFQAANSSLQAFQVMQRGAEDLLSGIAQRQRPGSRLVPTLIIQGSDDKTVNPIIAEQMVELMRRRAENLYPDGDAATLKEEQSLESGGRRYRQLDLSLGRTLLLRRLLIDGLGHAWSGGDPQHKFFDPAGPDASQLILDFLLSYRLPKP